VKGASILISVMANSNVLDVTSSKLLNGMNLIKVNGPTGLECDY
jgi:hypothetical protein